jgi:hypothetical protein
MLLRRCRSRNLPVVLVPLALIAVAPAQPLGLERGEHVAVPFDPGAICDALRDAYAEGPFVEHVTITVRRTGGAERSDSLSIHAGGAPRANGERSVEIRLGPLTVRTESDAVYAFHAEAPDAYFAAPIERGESALDAVERVLPPIPAPQLGLILGDDRGCPDRLPYVRDLRWTECVVNAEARPATATLHGEGEGVVVEWRAELEPVRLTSFEMVFEDEVSGRSRVSSIADLAPAPASVRIGDILTGWLVHPVTAQTPGVVSELVPLEGPAVVVLFTRWNRDVSLGLKSAIEAADGFEGFRVIPLAVFAPDAEDSEAPTDMRAWLAEIEPKVDPLPLFYSRSPERTIRRLDRHADVEILVLDEDRVVRYAERIDNIFVFDEPGVLTNRIVAALTAR